MGKPYSYCVEARLDARIVASLVQYYIKAGCPPQSKSALINMVVRDFSAILKHNNLVEEVISTERALDYIEAAGLKSTRGHRSPVLEQLRREEIEMPRDLSAPRSIAERADQIRTQILREGLQDAHQ